MRPDPIEASKDLIKTFNPNLTLLGWERKDKRTVKVSCNIHGNAWSWGNPYIPRLDHLKKGNSGCPKCSSTYRMSKSEKIAHLNETIDNTYKVIDIPEYKNCYSKCHIFCKYHGNGWEWKKPWLPTVTNLQAGQGCPQCALAQRGDKTEQDVIDILSRRLPANLKISGIKSFHQLELSKFYIACSEHGECWKWGNPWIPTGGTLTSGRNCPKCSNRYTPTKEEIFEELKGEPYTLIDIPNYKNGHSLCHVKCPTHGKGWEWGNPWKPKVIKLRIRGSACPKCSNVYRPTEDELVKQLQGDLQGSTLSFHGFVNYTGYTSDCYVSCSVHGNAWEWANKWLPGAHVLKQYKSCAKCTGAYSRSESENIERLKAILPPHLKFREFVEYDGLLSRCAISCAYHGDGREWDEAWTPRLGNVINGTRCPKCSAGTANLVNVLRDELLQEQGRILYYIKFKYLLDNSVFWKIGVASLDGGVERRYRASALSCDKLEIIELQEVKTSSLLALACEYMILLNNTKDRADKTHIMVSSNGGTECFDKDITQQRSLQEIFDIYTYDTDKLIDYLRSHLR